MSFKEKLCFNFYRKDFATILKEGLIFQRVCHYFASQNVFSEETSRYYTELHDIKDNRIEIVNIILDRLYHLSLKEIFLVFNRINDRITQDLAIKLSKFNIVWLTLVNKVKTLRKKDSCYVRLLPFGEVIYVKLDEIVTNISLSKIIKTDMIDKEYVKANINYKNFYKIFKENSSKILVQGEPGMGKTVHLKNLLYTWSRDKWSLSNELLVLKLILKDVEPENDLYDELIKQNFQGIDFITKGIVKRMIDEKSKNIILLIDGVDEFYRDEITITNFLNHPDCDVQTVLWSRNWKAKEISHTCDIVFELTGANISDMKNFFLKCFKDEQKTDTFFENVIEENETLQNFCRVPLLAMIIFYIWKMKEEVNGRSLYELYEKIIETIQTKKGIEDEYLDCQFLEKFYRNCLRCLPENMNRIKLNEEEIKDLSAIFDGILQCIECKHQLNNTIEIQFYHLSFQEFFAAKYIIFCFKQKKMNDLDNLLEKLLNKYSKLKLFKILDFISSKSVELGKDLLKSSNLFKKMNETDEISEYFSKENKLKNLSTFFENLNDSMYLYAVEIGKDELEKIDIGNCTLSVETIIVSLYQMKNLKYVKFSGDKFSPVKVYPNLAEYFTEFKNLKEMTLIDETTFLSIQRLEDNHIYLKLKFSNIFGVYDIRKLLEKLNFVSKIHVSLDKNCQDEKIILEIILIILNNCQHLKEIHLDDTILTTETFVELLSIFEITLKSYIYVIFKNSILDVDQLYLLHNQLYRNRLIRKCKIDFHGMIEGEEMSLFSNEIEQNQNDPSSTDIVDGNNSDNQKKRRKNTEWTEITKINFIRIFQEDDLKNHHPFTISFPTKIIEEDAINDIIDVNYKGYYFFLQIISNKIQEYKLKSDNISQKIEFVFPKKINDEDCLIISKIMQNLPNIKIIKLLNCKRIKTTFNDIFNNLEKSCDTLTEIVFYKCYKLDENYSKTLGNILKNCKKLEIFKISYCKLLSSDGFGKIIQNLKYSKETLIELEITKLKLTNENEILLGELFSECKKLEKIDIENTINFNENFQNIIDGLKFCSKTLKKVKINHYNLNPMQKLCLKNFYTNNPKISKPHWYIL